MHASQDAALSLLAVEWCDRKSIGSLDTYGNSDQARRNDLKRVADLLLELKRGQNRRPLPVRTLAEHFDGLLVGDLDVDVVLAIVQELRRRYSYATARRTLSTLRSWTRWMSDQGILRSDPCADEMIVLPPDPLDQAAGVAHFDHDDLEALRTAALHPAAGVRSAWPQRDVVVLDLGALCGCRASEIAGLRFGDIDFGEGLIHLRIGTKGRKPRDVPVPGRLLDAMTTYTESVPTRSVVSAPFISRVISGSSAPVDRFWVDRLVRRCAKQAGVNVPIQAVSHALRHSYGVTLATHNVPVPVIQELLGHADPRTTSVYTRMSARYLREVLTEAHIL